MTWRVIQALLLVTLSAAVSVLLFFAVSEGKGDGRRLATHDPGAPVVQTRAELADSRRAGSTVALHPQQPSGRLDSPSQRRWSEQQVEATLAGLPVDEQGNLQPGRELRAVLDTVFLGGDASLTLAELAWLQQQVIAVMPDTAGRQAADVMERYFHYSNMYRDLSGSFQQRSGVEALASGQQQLARLRRDYLGEALANALFADEERMARVTLHNMRTQMNTRLDDTEKAEQWLWLTGEPADRESDE